MHTHTLYAVRVRADCLPNDCLNSENILSHMLRAPRFTYLVAVCRSNSKLWGETSMPAHITKYIYILYTDCDSATSCAPVLGQFPMRERNLNMCDLYIPMQRYQGTVRVAHICISGRIAVNLPNKYIHAYMCISSYTHDASYHMVGECEFVCVCVCLRMPYTRGGSHAFYGCYKNIYALSVLLMLV